MKIIGTILELLHIDGQIHSMKDFKRFLRNTEKKKNFYQKLTVCNGVTEIIRI